jgi:hypothetical protein
MLWTPFSRISRTPFWSGLTMAALLCWYHLFLLPLLFAVRGQPRAKVVSTLLKWGIFGAIFSCIGVALGMFVAVLLVFTSLGLLTAFGRPLWPETSPFLMVLLTADYCACLAPRAAATGILAGLVAKNELPANVPGIWRIALGAAMASIMMTPWLPINLLDGLMLLLIAALPSLILFRPTAPTGSAPMNALSHDVISRYSRP